MAGVLLEKRDRIALVVLNRPERKNALSRQLLAELDAAFRAAAADATTRAILLTGAGDDAFCAGADLRERRAMQEDEVRAMLDSMGTLFRAIDRSPKPVVAAIHGYALGGGLELALACDLRVGSASAVLALPETSLGIIPGAGGTQRLARAIGASRAKELILFGRRLGAEEAAAIGLLHRVAAAEVVEDALAWMQPLASGAPIAIAAAMDAIDEGATLPLEDGLRVERAMYERCLRSQDRCEALEAWAEKRKPVFRGT